MNFWIQQGETQEGPFPWEHILERRRSGSLSDGAFLWAEGWTDWRPVTSIPDLVVSPAVASSRPGRASAHATATATPAATLRARRFRPWLVGGVMAVVLLVLGAVGLVFLGFGSGEGRSNPSVAGTDTGDREGSEEHAIVDTGTNGLDVAAQPIVASTKTLLASDRDRLHRAFFEREIRDRYLTFGRQNTRWHSNALQLIEAWIQRQLIQLDNEQRIDPAPYAAAITSAGCDDPLILYLAARAETDTARNRTGVHRARLALERSAYPAFVCFLATCAEGNLQEGFGEDTTALDMAALKHLKAAFADSSLRREDAVVFHDCMSSDRWGHRLTQKQRDGFIKVLAEQPDYRWFADLLVGKDELSLAWKARGSGAANTVTQEGWEGFERHLRRAEERLRRSWTDRPDLPWAAQEMISVAMGRGGAKDMRLWFDRAVTARFDGLEAYSHFRWGLRPRWHGSHAAMMAFGEAALATGRFDTDVPFQYYRALADIGSERYPSDPWRLLKPSEIWTKVARMYEGYLAEPTQQQHARGWRSSYAIVAYLSDHFDEAHRLLGELDWKPLPSHLMGWGADVSLAVDEVAARFGPAGPQVAAAELSVRRARFREAMKSLERASSLAPDHDATIRYVRERVATLRMEDSFADGHWVSLRATSGLAGWQTGQGDWTAAPDGALVVKASESGHLMTCRARVGDWFEMEGDVEVVKPGPDGFEFGVAFGMPEWDSTTWQSVRISAPASGPCRLQVGPTLENDQNWRDWILAKPGSARIRIIVFDGKLRVSIDGQALNEIRIWTDRRGLNRNALVGFVGGRVGGSSEVRYSHWRVRDIRREGNIPM